MVAVSLHCDDLLDLLLGKVIKAEHVFQEMSVCVCVPVCVCLCFTLFVSSYLCILSANFELKTMCVCVNFLMFCFLHEYYIHTIKTKSGGGRGKSRNRP